MVKHLPTIQETRVQSLGWEGPLEKEMATHSSILASRIPWTEEHGTESDTTERLHFHFERKIQGMKSFTGSICPNRNRV